MRLSRLYTNKPGWVEPIEFRAGLNVVLAEIRLPENRTKDTHNLGKTTLGRVIDFCLLKGRDKRFFLFKHLDLFGDFVFFLEIELLDGSFITVRRGVEHHSKIFFKRHPAARQDFVDLPDEDWDHPAVPIEKAKQLLDGALDLRDLEPWSYRKIVGYLLRTQDDYRDVFQLAKFKGGDAEWKPFLAQLLGFNAQSIVEHYVTEADLEELRGKEAMVERELGGSIEDISKSEGILLLKQNESLERHRLLDSFDFQEVDAEKTRMLVDELDARIARLNARRYSLVHNRKKIVASLADDEVLFDSDRASELFAEAGVMFAGQIKRDFEQLLAFNRAISEERRVYLSEELAEIDAELKSTDSEIAGLSEERTKTLSFLTDTDVFMKYKQAMDDLATLRADIIALEHRRESLGRLQVLRSSIRAAEEQKRRTQEVTEADVEAQNEDRQSRFSAIRVLFNGIVEQVIDRKAVLSVAPNSKNHLEFRAEIMDDAGLATSADAGNTYRKLLCVAMDLALLRAHLDGYYPRFVFHDGVFESLDDRKKENLLGVIRDYADLGIQHIITVIDSDLPSRGTGLGPVFGASEVILRLHDEGDEGRLFKMKSW